MRKHLAALLRFTIQLVVLVVFPFAVQTNSQRISSAGPTPDRTATEGYFTGADGVRLFYRKFGRGKNVVVLLHGGPGGTMNNGWEMLPLARGQTLILYDQRGGGRSELVSDPKLLTAQYHVRDLEALRQHFKLEQMSLLGISWGSMLAALYTAEHSERVERLLLVSPGPIARIPFAQERREKINAIIGKERLARSEEINRIITSASDQEARALFCESVAIGFRPYLANQANLDRVVHARCDDTPPAAIRNRQVVSRATLGSLGDWDFRPILMRFQMPALVFEGAKTNVPLDSTREWAATIPNARLMLIPNAGHEFWGEEPDAFIKAADQFLRGRYPKEAELVQKH